ncbi:D-2-hydroxyacid dehydrogenase family protein [Nocardioides sp. URHA0020]|uniref:D-2-hydroxyacid dehydrogenase family protein n=1 Tax=Nocardioides sp. URHA0020 TaxID=1380392 RepID=UPI0018CC174F|nr:D-2-hydroxyacid dehydrogenase family protein [Nocardioides sp. URHA0020]
MHCVILDDYQGVATSYADWSVLDGVSVASVRDHVGDEDTLAEILAGAQILVVMRERTPLTRTLVGRLPDLRLVVTTGRRNASIDLEACREHGVTVCGTGSSPTAPAELTWALILGLARHLVAESELLASPDSPWQSTVGTDLAGATLGLVGLGRIGARVARVARAFEMDVLAWSPHLTEERAAAEGARRVEKSELLAGSDFVSLHLVLSESTRGTVGATELAAMRPTSYLVNTSRAGLVDTDALVAALRAGRIAGAGLDVYDEEPLPAGHPLLELTNLLAVPHLGYVTEGNYRTFFTEAVEDIAAWQAGEPVRELT